MMVEQQPQPQHYKRVRYNHAIFEIPVRHIDYRDVILLDDIQAVIPKATALLIDQSTKLVPFDVAENRLTTKRITAAYLTDDIYEVYVPPASCQVDDCSNSSSSSSSSNSNHELQIKLDQLTNKVDQLLSLMLRQHDQPMHNGAPHSLPPSASSATVSPSSQHHHAPQHPQPHLSGQAAVAEVPGEVDDDGSHNQQQDAPPSYETSVYSTIKALNARLLEFESHIPKKHVSPKWLTKREKWVSQVRAAASSTSAPAHTLSQEQQSENSSSHGSGHHQNAAITAANTSSSTDNSNNSHPINQFAMSLIELEMALLWSAVTEDWIQQERDTWINLLGNARSERHLAGALINLERHTLVMDASWTVTREAWVNELLEIMTHFL